jgi:hypothetical protein
MGPELARADQKSLAWRKLNPCRRTSYGEGAMAARALPLLVGLVCLCLALPAGAGWLDDFNEKACAPEGGLYSRHHTKPVVPDVAACTSECFRYQITCRNGKHFLLADRYRPEASAADIFFCEHGHSEGFHFRSDRGVCRPRGVWCKGSKERCPAPRNLRCSIRVCDFDVGHRRKI